MTKKYPDTQEGFNEHLLEVLEQIAKTLVDLKKRVEELEKNSRGIQGLR